MKICLLILLTIWKAPALDAGPSDITNGVLAAVLAWIRLMDMEIVNLYLARSWPMPLLDVSEPQWRPTEVTDTDNVVRMDRRQRLLRWDRRPPNEIFLNGFVPIVTNENPDWAQTDLYNFAKSNVPSIFVSTTKTQRNKKNYVWTPRSATRGIVYQYEIYAPGGLDVNESLLDQSPWPTQMEVAFPGGIQNVYIRSARELRDGRIQRIWINPNFLDPNELEPIVSSSRTEQIIWYEDHPDGNHKDDERSKRSTSSDDDLMFGGDGDVVEDPLDNETNNPHPFPSGVYTIESAKDNFFLDLAQNIQGGVIHSHEYNGLANQIWEFTYDDSKKAYKIKSRQNTDLLLSWNSNASPSEIILRGYTDSGDNNQYWLINQTVDGCILRNLKNLNMIITAEDKSSPFGGKEVIVNTEISTSSTEQNQKWRIHPLSFQTIPNGNYRIFNRFKSDVVVDFSNQKDFLVHGHSFLDGDNQEWKFSYDSNKQAYKIRSGLNSDLLLSWNSNASPAERLIRAYPESGSKNQYWRIEQSDDGSYRLRNLEDLSMILMLDNQTNSPYGGLNLIVHDDSGDSNILHRKWRIIPVSYQTVPDGNYHIFNRNLPDIVIDFTNEENSLVHGHNYFGNNNQKWSFVYDGNKKAYKIKSNVNSNLLLCWNSNASPAEMVLRAYDDSGSNNQYWRIEISNDGSYKLRNLENLNKIIAIVDQDSPYGGRELVVSDNVESGNTWYLKRLGEIVIPDGKFKIATKLNYKKVIDYNRDKVLIITYNLNLVSSEWEIKYDTTRKAYNIYSVEYNNLGWVYQDKNFNVRLDNIDGPDHGDWRYFWTIEYNIQKGCYLIRSLREPSHALSYSDDNSVVTDTSQYSDNQLYHFIPI